MAANIILTAGHCAESTTTGVIHEPSTYTVITGNVEWTATPRQVSGVSRVILYPGFDRATLTGDAALLILSTPTSAPAIALASDAADSSRLNPGTTGLIAGWGDTTFQQQLAPARLSYADAVVQRTDFCQTEVSSFNGADELCATDPPGEQTGPCYGDSGGPLLTLSPLGSSGIELGIISH